VAVGRGSTLPGLRVDRQRVEAGDGEGSSLKYFLATACTSAGVTARMRSSM
jgi:hypothetical protein